MGDAAGVRLSLADAAIAARSDTDSLSQRVPDPALALQSPSTGKVRLAADMHSAGNPAGCLHAALRFLIPRKASDR